MRKAVVIPSYNAAETLPSVVETLPAQLPDEGGIAIIVHDCSPDRTGEVADQLAKSYKHVEVVHHEQNRGYGGALKTGLAKGYELGFAVFPIVHSDGQYAPEMAMELCKPIESGETDIVQGSRMLGENAKESMPYWTRYLPNRILTEMENFVFGTKVAEFHSGYMIFSRRLLEIVPYQNLQNNYNFDAEMMIMAHMCGVPIVEKPIPTRYDDSTSSLDPIPYGLNVLRMMWRHNMGHYRKLLDDHTAATGQHHIGG